MKQLKEYPGPLKDTAMLAFKTEAEWLAERKKYITASDVATLFCDEIEAQGESVYQTPYALGLEKSGLLEREFSESESARNWFAHEAEDLAAKYWRTQEPRLPTYKPPKYHLIIHKDYPHLAATLDLMTVLDSGPAPLEIKAPGEWNSKEWSDEAPLKFQVQNNIQMLLTGCTHGVIFGLIGGYTPKWTVMERNQDLCDLAVERAKEFMENLARGILPPPDGREKTTKALKLLHPNDDGEIVALPQEALEWYRQIDYWESVRKDAERKEESYKNLVRSVLGEHTYGEFGPVRFTWKTTGGSSSKIEVPVEYAAKLVEAGVKFEIKTSPVYRKLTRRMAKEQ